MSVHTPIELLLSDFSWITLPAGKATYTITAKGHPDPSEKEPDTTYTRIFQTKGFQIAKAPITNAQWQAFTDAPDGYRDRFWWDFDPNALLRYNATPPQGTSNKPQDPRTMVLLEHVLAFCRWVSYKTGVYVSIPTESEWNYACHQPDFVMTSAQEWTISTYKGDEDAPTGDVDLTRQRVIKTSTETNGRTLASNFPNMLQQCGFRLIQTDTRIIPRMTDAPHSVAVCLDNIRRLDAQFRDIHPCVLHLVQHRDPQSVVPLLELITSDIPAQRNNALGALCLLSEYLPIPPQPMVDYMVARERFNLDTSSYPIQILRNGDVTVVPMLADLVNHPEKTIRHRAFYLLSYLHFERRIAVDNLPEMFIAGLQDADKAISALCIGGLKRIHPTKAHITHMTGLLESPTWGETALDILVQWES